MSEAWPRNVGISFVSLKHLSDGLKIWQSLTKMFHECSQAVSESDNVQALFSFWTGHLLSYILNESSLSPSWILEFEGQTLFFISFDSSNSIDYSINKYELWCKEWDIYVLWNQTLLYCFILTDQSVTPSFTIDLFHKYRSIMIDGVKYFKKLK